MAGAVTWSRQREAARLGAKRMVQRHLLGVAPSGWRIDTQSGERARARARVRAADLGEADAGARADVRPGQAVRYVVGACRAVGAEGARRGPASRRTVALRAPSQRQARDEQRELLLVLVRVEDAAVASADPLTEVGGAVPPPWAPEAPAVAAAGRCCGSCEAGSMTVQSAWVRHRKTVRRPVAHSEHLGSINNH